MSRKSKPPIALYSALADATRCRILEILKAAPTPVHVLAEAFSISRPAISRHLRVLKSAGLVAEVKKGRENVYAFKPARLDIAKAWLETLRSNERASATEAMPAAETQPAAEPAIEAISPAPKPAKTPRKRPAAKAEKPARETAPAAAPQAAPASQMGFDF